MVPDAVPAQRLLNLALSGGWKVVARVPRKPGMTGGCFSEGYLVENVDGRTGFLKALDFSGAMRSEDPSSDLEALTAAFNFERNLLAKCRECRMTRVVLAVDDGTVEVDPSSPVGRVQYLILERADGDVRSYVQTSEQFDLAWRLRALHHIATGLTQLHSQGIAHQDLKPSNVMVFRGTYSKIGDLGRASARGFLPPHEREEIAGDPSYAPPELLYHHIPADWSERRLGCDAYLLGSMIVFLFTGVSMNAALAQRLHPSHYPADWAGKFEDVLPFLRDAFARAIDDIESCIPVSVQGELLPAVRQLCDPDPLRRGHPKLLGRRAGRFSLERYVSLLDLLAKKAELGLAG
jgi:serine/threonine protein kinase